MPFGRLHEEAASDNKLLNLSNAAWRMWAMGLIYCQRYLTDGFIPETALKYWAIRGGRLKQVSEELCRPAEHGKAALWTAVKGGFQVHDYLQWNDSKEQILAARAMGKTRRALYGDFALLRDVKARDGNQCRYCGREVNWTDRRGPAGATYDHVEPQGPNTMENIVVACRGCNSSKGSKPLSACSMHLRPVATQTSSNSEPNSDLDSDLGFNSDFLEPTASGSGSGTYVEKNSVDDLSADSGVVVDAFRAAWRTTYGHDCSLLVSPLEYMKLEQQAANCSIPKLLLAVAAYFATTDAYARKAKHPFPLFLRDPMKYLATEAPPPPQRPPGCHHKPACGDAVAHSQRFLAEQNTL